MTPLAAVALATAAHLGHGDARDTLIGHRAEVIVIGALVLIVLIAIVRRIGRAARPKAPRPAARRTPYR